MMEGGQAGWEFGLRIYPVMVAQCPGYLPSSLFIVPSSLLFLTVVLRIKSGLLPAMYVFQPLYHLPNLVCLLVSS